MKSIQQFNALHGKTASRSELNKIHDLAMKEHQYHLANAIVTALDATGDTFNINLPELVAIVEPSQGLNAPRHKDFGKIGLDCSGRLLPGYLFDGYGNVVPSLNPDLKTRKNKKRLSDTCQDECKPCNENFVAKRVQKPKKPVIKTVKSSKSITKVVTNVQKKTKEKPYFTFSKNGSFEIPIGLIFTDEKRFQNRNKLDQRIINNIVKNFDVNQFDPIVIWQDANPKYGHTGRYFVLAGHHRFEAVKQLGYKTIQTKISNYTEKEAIKYAKETSNANRTLELPQERAKIYRKHIAGDNLSRKELLEFAKTNEGKNGNYILNLAYLNANGLMIQALDQLSETPDKQNATIIEKMADWIGEARKLHNEILNDANEFEMFKFLQDKSQSERIKTKAEFLQKITAATGVFFKAGDVLNLTRFTNKTEGENVYDAEYKELQKQLEMAVENKQSLLDRIKNPKNTGFIDPKDKDYKNIIVALENAIEKYNNQIKLLQSKIIDLSRKKGNYTNAGSNQVGLFGSKSIKLSSYTIASNCTDLTDANDGFNEVYDAIKEYKKLGKKIPAFWYTRSSKLVDRIKHFEIKEGLGVINENVESILFNRQIIKISKKGIINNDKILSLGKPFSILGNFIENFEITVSGSVIEKALSQSKDHNLNWGNFIDLPKNINNPVAIFISKTKGYVVLTKIKDINKKSVIVALHIDKQRKSCKIASMYIRSNPNTYKNWIDDNLHIYINEKSELYTYQQATIAIGGITHNAKVTKTIPNNNNLGLKFSEVLNLPKPILTKSNNLMNRVFDTLPINVEWQQLFQNPASNIKIALYGPPKQGKTSGALQIAEYSTNFGNVLYNFADQGFNKSTQDLWKNSGLANNKNATPSDVDSVAELEKEIATGKYKFVFIDMISEYIRKEKLRPEEFKDRFIKKYPNVSFILILEVTKGGNFKGDQGWTHLVDAIVTVDGFVMTNTGRYGSGDKIIWNQGAKIYNPKKYAEIMAKNQIIQSETTKFKFKEI